MAPRVDEDGVPLRASPTRVGRALTRMCEKTVQSAHNFRQADFNSTFGAASFSRRGQGSPEQAGSKTQVAMGLAKQERKQTHARERRISRKLRNRWLAVAFGVLVADAIVATVFSLLAPTDPRLSDVATSRRQSRTVVTQGVVALVDAALSLLVVVHVVQGILSASLDNFLEAAATKLLQAVFFSLLQTGYPTILRISFVSLLLLLRVVAASLIFRAAFLSGVLTARPARQLPKLIVSLLEMGAPVPPPGMAARLQQAQLYALERPLTIELVERLIRWLVPLRERAAAVGMGRRQVLVIGAFLLLMTGYSAFAEYWAIVGDQDEFFDEGQTEQITVDSFRYLSQAAYSVGQTTRDAEEAAPFLPQNVTTSTHRVVAVVLSGLRYDAMLQTTASGEPGPMMAFRNSLGTFGVDCKLHAELPSLSLPNWIGMLFGVKPEVHGLLGNRGPAEQQYSSIFSIARQLQTPATLVGTPWMVDLVRSNLEPLVADGSSSASWKEFEAHTQEADAYDVRREEAFFRALNSSARLIVGQFSEINTAAYLHGASYAEGAAYALAIQNKATMLGRMLSAINAPGAPPTTLLVLSDHGHLARGGAGGGSEEERAAPLLAYRRGSRMGLLPATSSEMEMCASGALSPVDLAPTISALLYQPVPRHAQGEFITALFDRNEAVGLTSSAQYAAVDALRDEMGVHNFRALDTWLWRDYYHQQHSHLAAFLANPTVNERAELDLLDADEINRELADVAEKGSAAAYMEMTTSLHDLAARMRTQASQATSARNQFVAFFLLGLILLLALFAMQLQTFCDPLIVFLPRRGWRRSKDARAAGLALGLCCAYYVVTIGIFYLWLGAQGFYWSSSIVALPENTRNFLLVAILPGLGMSYLIVRTMLLRYAVWPSSVSGRSACGSMFTFIATEEIQAFRQIDSLYLARFYVLLWSLLGACVLGVLSSRFSFIVPLVFYNKYIDEALWEYRFVVMTVQVMTVPLVAATMFFLYRWPQTRVDLHAMNTIHALKVEKADRRRGAVDAEGANTDSAVSSPGFSAFGGGGPSGGGFAAIREEEPPAAGVKNGGGEEGGGEEGGRAATGLRKRPMWRRKSDVGEAESSSTREEMAERFEEVHQMFLEQRQEQREMVEETEHLEEKSVALAEELAEIVEELQANQEQINAGVKELETLIIRRFETMQEVEEEAKRLKEARETALAGGGDGSGDEVDPEMDTSGLDPAARRQLRRQRLVNEQRKRIAEEEAEKAEADAAIRALQAELAKLLEANSRLQRKVEASEHNVEETRDAIEDMAFQKAQCEEQKKNALQVLTSEAAYLNEHQGTVQRKASELTSKMAEIESAVSASGYKLQRVKHANELATADRRRELGALTAETQELEAKFEQLKADVRVLYKDKAKLRQQLVTAEAEAADVEKTVKKYRKTAANLIA